MTLTDYRNKRDFTKTPEPAGKPTPRGKPGALAFVVQQHQARQLHYDFRLELDGVLKSWAVPKGPSLDPRDKRLAVQVEDHPLEYGDFEGVISEGEYGGGTVMLWDRGTWTPADPDPAAAYKRGALKFRLDGQKLHGNWVLVRMGGKAGGERRENWLLIKERDAAAAPGGGAVTAKNPASVATGRSLDEIASDRDRVWAADRDERASDTPAAEDDAARAGPPAATPERRSEARENLAAQLSGVRKGAMPQAPRPQLATLVDRPPMGPEWLHEVKYDGYRLFARIERGRVRLLTRNDLDWTAKFPALAAALAELPVDQALIDGEIADFAPDGTTSFAGLQDKIATGRTGALVFCAFDLLHLDGWDLTGVALEDRKTVLSELIPPQARGLLRYSDHHAGGGSAFFRHACHLALEGVVSKRRDRPYRPGRSGDWLKVKCQNREEFAVIGFTDPAGSRKGLGALVLGYHDRQGKLHYAGRVGTGFGTDHLLDLRRRLDPLARREPPSSLPRGLSKTGVHWTEPKLVVETRFAGWTADRILRQPAFLGLREDKPAEEVVHEEAKPASAANPKAARQRARPATKAERQRSAEIAGVRLTHPDRVLYPEQGITKRDLANYYWTIRDWALPHLAQRPLSLARCPEGRDEACFFQKHVGSGAPEVLGRVKIAEKSRTDTYLVVENVAGLVALVQTGVLEIHPWGSTVKRLETPDRLTFDFDPDPGLPWSWITEAALALREALQGLGLESFAKTTGGKGLHVVVPLAPRLGWDEVRAFSRHVAEAVAARAPERYMTNPSKQARTGRIYIDYLRNSRCATAIGAYSPRARPGAPVARRCFGKRSNRRCGPTPSRCARCRSGWPVSRKIPGPKSARSARR
ncbi:MAG TPA: DNA ligase D [Stellaceae bacterium]|nr:DNA ligase D [Stellaceae bacterium]